MTSPFSNKDIFKDTYLLTFLIQVLSNLRVIMCYLRTHGEFVDILTFVDTCGHIKSCRQLRMIFILIMSIQFKDTCFYKRMELLARTVPANNLSLAGTVPANKFLLARTPKNLVPISAAPKVPEFCPEVEGNPVP